MSSAYILTNKKKQENQKLKLEKQCDSDTLNMFISWLLIYYQMLCQNVCCYIFSHLKCNTVHHSH